jgi:hypothetical protein
VRVLLPQFTFALRGAHESVGYCSCSDVTERIVVDGQCTKRLGHVVEGLSESRGPTAPDSIPIQIALQQLRPKADDRSSSNTSSLIDAVVADVK